MKYLMILAGLLLLAGPVTAQVPDSEYPGNTTFEEDFAKIRQLDAEGLIWSIDLHKGYRDSADTEREWNREQEIIDAEFDRLRSIISQ